MNEQREIISWIDEETWHTARAIDITSTESGSLFGYGRETAFELACRKDGKTESRFKPNERTEIGKEIEHAIAIRAARQYGVIIKHKNEYMRIHTSRMGSSFDYEVIGFYDSQVKDNRLVKAFETHGPGLLEVKNVDRLVYNNEWINGENPEAPSHIEIQLQHQLEVCELNWGAIVAFVGGNHIEMVLRLRDRAVGASIRYKIEKFWHGLAKGEYPPVLLPEDIDVLKQLYGHAEPGSVLDARNNDSVNDWIQVYMDASAEEKRAVDRKQTAQGQLLQLIGNAERVVGAEAVITCGLVGPCEIAYTRTGYRNWRVTPKKGASK